jgi:hypothetical protein
MPIFWTFLTKLNSHFLSLQPSHILDLNSSNINEWCERNIRFENGGPLSYYAANIGKFYRDKLSVLLTPEDSRVVCPKISVRNYHFSLRNNPEERSSHLLRSRSLRPRKYQICLSWNYFVVAAPVSCIFVYCQSSHITHMYRSY